MSDFRKFVEQQMRNPWRQRIRIPKYPANAGNQMQGTNPLTQAVTNIGGGITDTLKKKLGRLAEPLRSANPELTKLLSDLTSPNSKGITVTGVAKKWLGTEYINLEYWEAIRRKLKKINADIEKLKNKIPKENTPEYQELMQLKYARDKVDWNHPFSVVKPATVASGGQFSVLVPFKSQHQAQPNKI